MGAMYEKQSSSRNNIQQVVPYTSAAAPTTAAFSNETYQIRLAATSVCYYLVSEAASVTTATSLNAALLPNNWVEYVTVTPGQKLSVVRTETNGLVTGTSGTLYVTELA